MELLGDYAVTADFSTFTSKNDRGGPRDDVANLRGRHLESAQEGREGAGLTESLVKWLTGGDMVRGVDWIRPVARHGDCPSGGHKSAYAVCRLSSHQKLPSAIQLRQLESRGNSKWESEGKEISDGDSLEVEWHVR